MSSPKTGEAVEWYSQTRPIYHALATKVESILREVVDASSINYYTISSRAKSVESYERKASQDRYKDPRLEIVDNAGVRVITYTQSDATRVASLVRDVFDILPEHSIDKAEELGVDRVGYRSIHFVATLGKERQQLPENKVFADLRFEIQVRTILQHAWAEFEHDRNYKFAGVLPVQVKRRVSVLAGSLELIDREFDNIANEIDRYSAAVDKKTESGDLAVPIDSTSLMTYLRRKFNVLVEKGFDPTLNNADAMLIEELRSLGIVTLEDLDKIVPHNLVEIESRFAGVYKNNFCGLLRQIMIIHDPDRYFGTAWKEHWIGGMNSPSDREIFRQYGIDIDHYDQKYHFSFKRPKEKKLEHSK
jgi:ppGpp synthetase/RelA/SpoT-type nucleotidyltranferase